MKFRTIITIAIILTITNKVICSRENAPEPVNSATESKPKEHAPEVTTPVTPTTPEAVSPVVPSSNENAPSHIQAKPLPPTLPPIIDPSHQCVEDAIAKILKSENKCIESRSKPHHKICKKYRIRDSCRKQSNKKARKWSRKCKSPVVLMQTQDVAPEDCNLCGEGANKILEDCLHGNSGFTSRCKGWIWVQRKIQCYQDKYKHFAEICGKKSLTALEFRTEAKPAKCEEESTEVCANNARARIEKTFSACSAEADKITDNCKAFEARVECWSRKHKRAYVWSKFCKTDLFYPMPHFRPPPGCYGDNQNSESNDGQTQGDNDGESSSGNQVSHGVHHGWYHHIWDNWYNFGHSSGAHDTPITCQEKASQRINSKHATCEQAAELQNDQCAKLAHHRHCDEMTKLRTIRWNTKCGIDLPLPKPRLGLPMNCASNSGSSCAKKASKQNKASIQECLDRTKTMKMNSCGLLHYRNNCYLEGIKTQIAKTKECSWTWVDILVKLETNSECPMDNCLATGKDLIGKINDACRESVANSKMNECAKARRINACLQDYEFVPKFFNQTCHEKMLLMLSYEDESLACAKNDTQGVATTAH